MRRARVPRLDSALRRNELSEHACSASGAQKSVVAERAAARETRALPSTCVGRIELLCLLEMFFGQLSHPKVLEPASRASNGKADCWE